MIKKIRTVEYAVVCDKCGNETLSDSDAQEAIRTAKANGWDVYDRCFETPGAVCPTCQEAAQAGEGAINQPIVFMDGVCPVCGEDCGNGGCGPLRCSCGWVGEEKAISTIDGIFSEEFGEQEGGEPHE